VRRASRRRAGKTLPYTLSEKDYLCGRLNQPVHMFAIVTIAGQQFKVSEGQELFVHQLDAAAGDQVNFDQVHLIAPDSGDPSIGAPTVSGASISATVKGHVRGDKVIVFKKKRRKGYRRKNGHRQSFSRITIDSIAS